MATIMALSAAAGVPSENLTIDHLLNSTNQDWLRDFESRAVYYGKSTGFLSRTMKSEGPSDLTHAILYENLIKDISNSSDQGKIIAIYPEEGMLYSDHPFCIPNAWWISEEQKMVAEAFLQYLELEETVASAIDYGFRPINESILLNPEISSRFDSVFDYDSNGIISNISHIPEQKAPLDGEALLKMPDLWLLTKATA
jgi:Ca-activated chloride channel family protein